MAREEQKQFSVQCKLTDKDFEDVFQIYTENERGSEKQIALVTCIMLFMVCIVLLIILKNFTFIFYGIGCLIIGLSYFLVPVNRKFLATNQLLLGTHREMTFYQTFVTSFELIEGEAELTEEEREEAETVFKTDSMVAYENKRGFLLADGKITNGFLYIPKRCLTDEECAELMDFLREKCAGGYQQTEAESLLGDSEETSEEDTDEDDTEMNEAVYGRFYGGKKLHVYDDEGHRVTLDDQDEEEAEAEAEEDAGTLTAPPEMDVDAELREILSEDDSDE